MNYITIIGTLIYILLVILTSRQESKRRRIHFVTCLIILILATPLFGYFIVSSFPSRNPIGCNWCGNKENEAEICAICGKKVTSLTTDGES